MEADWLSSLMCINIDVLFGIIAVIRVWFDVMVSAAGFNNINSRCENSITGFQHMTV